MFAYCLNNPILYIDEDGNYAEYHARQFGKMLGNWLYDIFSANENEKDKNGRPTTKAKIKQTLNSVVYNAEISAGIGMGLYSEGTVLDAIGISAGMYVTNYSVVYNNGVWQSGQEAYAGISATFAWFEIGGAESGFRPNGGDWEGQSWHLLNDTKETWTIVSAAIFAGPGASVSFGFNLNNFLQDMEKVWKG